MQTKKRQLIKFVSRRNVYLRMLAAGALIIAFAVAAYVSYSMNRLSEIEKLQKEADGRMSLISTKLFAPTDKYSFLPTFVADYRVVAEALSRPNDARRILDINIFLDRLSTEAGASAIYLLNLDGVAIASSNWNTGESFVGNNYAFRPYFINAVKSGKGRFYGMGLTTKMPGYYISSLVKRNDVPLGVVVAKIDMRASEHTWDTSGSALVVTDGNGIIFLSTWDEWMYRPLWPLTGTAKEKLKLTRQYEGVLKPALSIKLDEQLRPDGQVVRIDNEMKHQYGGKEDVYLMMSSRVPDSDWTVSTLTSMDSVAIKARWAAMTAVGGIALCALLFMYLNQVRVRIREREEARVTLELAHHELEQRYADLHTLSEELRVNSITDSLTGIFNRRFFLDAAAKLASAANRHYFPVSIMMIDVDHFKQVNDRHGHPAGDKVLQVLASLYREAMRESDVIARYGGEEFIIALPHTDAQAAQLLAERIRNIVMNHPIEVDEGKSLQVTISIGVSAHRANETSIEHAVKRADEALYEAKNGGRNRVVSR